jgi:hypothetical protein
MKTKSVFLDIKKMKTTAPKVLAAFGGMVAGRAASGLLDKVIETQTVSGFLEGIRMKENVARYVKPAVITAVGLGLYAHGEKSKNEIIKYGAIGFSAYGASQLLTAVTGKGYFSGLLGETGNDFRIIDENGQEMRGGGSFGAPYLPELRPAIEPVYDGFGSDAEYVEGLGEFDNEPSYVTIQ